MNLYDNYYRVYSVLLMIDAKGDAKGANSDTCTQKNAT